MPFSLSKLKISFVSMLVSWAGFIELNECSVVRILLCILYVFSWEVGFLPFFVSVGSSLYTLGLPVSFGSIFLHLIYLSCLSKKKLLG